MAGTWHPEVWGLFARGCYAPASGRFFDGEKERAKVGCHTDEIHLPSFHCQIDSNNSRFVATHSGILLRCLCLVRWLPHIEVEELGLGVVREIIGVETLVVHRLFTPYDVEVAEDMAPTWRVVARHSRCCCGGLVEHSE